MIFLLHRYCPPVVLDFLPPRGVIKPLGCKNVEMLSKLGLQELGVLDGQLLTIVVDPLVEEV